MPTFLIVLTHDRHNIIMLSYINKLYVVLLYICVYLPNEIDECSQCTMQRVFDQRYL